MKNAAEGKGPKKCSLCLELGHSSNGSKCRLAQGLGTKVRHAGEWHALLNDRVLFMKWKDTVGLISPSPHPEQEPVGLRVPRDATG